MNTITKQKSYSFKNKGGTATIDIFADIDDYFGYSANQIKEDLNNFDGNQIVVNINSAGGSVTEGIAIANLLKADPRHVTTRAVGVAASIASVILMAGDTVQMAKNSFIMIHNVWADPLVQTWGEAEDLRKAADELNQHADTIEMMTEEIVSFYLDNIKKREKYIDNSRSKTRKELERLMKSQNWLNGKTAKSLGLIDEIKDLSSSASNKIQARIYNQIKIQNFKLPLNMEIPEVKNEEEETTQNGTSLGNALQAKIDVLLSEDEELTQAEVVQSMADAAGITPDTVNQILSGEVDCPPLERLEGFAEALKMEMSEIMTAAEVDGCMYGEEEETEEDKAESKEDCKECQKDKVETEANNSSLLQKIKAGINTLLGRNKEVKPEPSNKAENKKETDLQKQIGVLQAENKTLKASAKKATKETTEALNFLKDTQSELLKINQVKNRAGEPFKNLSDLMSEYEALIAHNKEVGGKPVNSGTPVAEGELTSPVEKSTGQKNKQSLQERFSEMKANVEAKQKKDDKNKK